MKKNNAKTIEIFLPDGSPKSIKVASITSRTAEVTYIPRSKLEHAKKRDSLHNVGIYLLVGSSEEHAKKEVYIGEAENCLIRLSQHNATKDFWDYALVITSKTNQFTKTHVKYLEWLACKLGRETKRCTINNSTTPSKPYVSESMEADLIDCFETISTLVSTLGLPIFQSTRNQESAEKENQQIFTISRRGISGNGMYTDEGFVVLANSKFHKETTPSLAPAVIKEREQLLNDDLLQETDKHYELKEDVLFNSPSYAGACVTGRSTNGWTAWKLQTGETLSDVYRKDTTKA
ncbi:MAG: GIY-YIG nuclease family protein [Alphaproteobacteria bacterium]|jgi:hypothetical protein|nr:GIY-YIG nuclease family protein [Alphaproteobacteria bacterium]MDP7222991.1 GIY-YIG nuclease family protein [Alphaproteobacteria bacterium]